MRWAFVLMTAALLTSGCGGPSYPDTYAVTGAVTYQGKPLEGANVVLVPDSPDGKSAGGVTDAEGKFSVMTYYDREHQLDGAISGSYGVTVSKLEVREAPEGVDIETANLQMMQQGPPKQLLPKKYNAPATSGFKVTVGDEPPKPLTLDLK